MLINSINNVKNVYSNQKIKKTSSSTQLLSRENNAYNHLSFKGVPKTIILENKAKIMASLDIMSRNPKIKMPVSEIEKKAVLELLEQRLKLDKYVRLRQEKRSILSDIDKVQELMDSGKNSEAEALLTQLSKRGNIDAVLRTLDKQIEQEEKRNQPTFKYFDDLYTMMEKYFENKLINNNQIDKAWFQIKKNNINPDGKLSTAELVEIIKSGDLVKTSSSRINSRKELLAVLEKEYEELMCKGINIYATARENKEINNQYDKSRNIRYQLNEKYGDLIRKYPGVTDALEGIYAKVEKRYSFKVNQLRGVDIYPIGEIWDQMKDVEKAIKDIMEELPILKEKLANNPTNKTLEMEYAGKQVVLVGLREDWIRGVKHSLNYESINRQRMIDAGHIAEYDYLASQNKTINRHKLAMKIYQENNETIPEEYWREILG